MFKENDKVYVPRHTHMGWQPSIVVVKYKGDDGRWWCEIERNDYQGIPRLVNISFYSYEMFLIKEDEPNKAYNNCKSYIMRRYTDYYCNACEYKGKEAGIWSCHSCISHYDCKYGVDDKHEICSKFSPYRTVDREEYVDFDTYIDRLKNCDFNPNCEFHRMSVFKTCSFNRYMSELVFVHVRFKYHGRQVKRIYVNRKDWLDGSFYEEKKVVIDGKESIEKILKFKRLDFEYRLNRNGRPRKEDLPISQYFNYDIYEEYVLHEDDELIWGK